MLRRKYIIFSVPIKKEVANGKEEKEDDNGKKEEDDNSKKKKTITYKIKFIDSYRFMQSRLSDLTDNLPGINNKERKSCMERKKIKSECDFIGFKNNRLNYRWKECKIKQSKLINEAIKNFPITYQFYKDDLNKFVLLLRKGVYPYEYMYSWEKFNETSIPPKEAYYSNLNEEVISDADYAHVQKVWEVFKIKDIGKDHDLYVQEDTLLLADVFEDFRDKCIKIDGLDPPHCLSAPGLAWQACLKKQK